MPSSAARPSSLASPTQCKLARRARLSALIPESRQGGPSCCDRAGVARADSPPLPPPELSLLLPLPSPPALPFLLLNTRAEEADDDEEEAEERLAPSLVPDAPMLLLPVVLPPALAPPLPLPEPLPEPLPPLPPDPSSLLLSPEELEGPLESRDRPSMRRFAVCFSTGSS